MPRIRLVHWNAGEAAPRLAFLKKAGYTVDFGPLDPDVVRAIKTKPPDAFVIDLSRAPSHGREVAASFRQSKPTRFVPLVFVDGDPEKVEGIRKVLPDATYTGWNRIRSDLKKALAARPTTVATPPIIGYSGTPLPKKLGIKEDSIVALVGAPDGFEEILGELPRTVTVARKRSSKNDLILWFVKSQAELKKGIVRMSDIPDKSGLWIAWPKKTSRLAGDVGEREVRETGLAVGLVDYKICAIDDTWSGLKFAVRKK